MTLKICVAGMGEVGRPTAKYAMLKGLEVWGYDINPYAIKLEQGNFFRTTTNLQEIPPLSIFLICVSTRLKGDAPDLSPVFDVCEKISQRNSLPSLVSIESTIVPGTSKAIYENIFKRKVCVIHLPHRFWSGDQVKHGVNQRRVIGAVNLESLNKGTEFYRKVLGIPLHIVSSIETAEMCKIAENAYRYVQIAFSEELKIICEKNKSTLMN